MKKCRVCQQNIDDNNRYCPFCGANQSQGNERAGVLVLDCPHCEDKGECKKSSTHQKVHSCAFCIAKTEVKISKPFPIVPCAYCQGLGKKIIDLKIQKQQKPFDRFDKRERRK
jgi:hypothetical protein